MKLKTVSGVMQTLLIIGMLTLAFNIQRAEPSEQPATEWMSARGKYLSAFHI